MMEQIELCELCNEKPPVDGGVWCQSCADVEMRLALEEQPIESAVIAKLRLDARAEGRADAAVTIRQMMADILPAVLVSGTVADGIGIENTLRNIRATFDQQCKDIEALKQAHQVLAQAMDFTANELDMVADGGSYTHAQKNGVVKHIAMRLRQWSGRRPMRTIVPPEPFNTELYDPNYIPF